MTFRKLLNTCVSVLPLLILVLIFSLTLTNINPIYIYNLLICTVFLILGMFLFTMGSESSMLKIGKYIGSSVAKSKKIWFMIITAIVLGFMVTIAEPDLAVLAAQIASVNKWLIIGIVALGVGIFFGIIIIKVVFNIKLSYILGISYSIILILSFFVPNSFLPLAFDSSGVTTGPVSVPFILAFGFGITSFFKSHEEDDMGFGLVALSSVGPIFLIMLMGLFSPNTTLSANVFEVNNIANISDIFMNIFSSMKDYLFDVTLVIVPIMIVFFIFNFSYLKLTAKRLAQISIGMIYTFVGIVLFLTGVTCGYLPLAVLLGQKIAALSYNWILIPISFVMGLTVVLSEPAIHILNKQVEELTGGVIKSKIMMLVLSIGIGFAMCLSVVRAMFNIPFLYIIVPIYLIIIVLLFFTPDIFIGISFDSGGIACGSLSAAFILPFIIGVCISSGTDVAVNAFGNLALSAAIPILSVEIFGIIFNHSKKRKKHFEFKKKAVVKIIEFK